MQGNAQRVGKLLREWRQRRRLSQLDLAVEAGISSRHLSFVETGRSQPSREMIQHLSEQLEIPLRERNVLLVAAGYAPTFPERPIGHAALAAAQTVINRILESHKPYPAFALDRHWTLAGSNGALPELYTDVARELLEPPVNALRLSLHPKGLAPRIANLSEWRAHLLARLRKQIEITADPVLTDLLEEVSRYPVPQAKPINVLGLEHAIAVPFKIKIDTGVLSFISTTTIFGTPLDITLSELALELFFAADDDTAARVQAISARTPAAEARILPAT